MDFKKTCCLCAQEIGAGVVRCPNCHARQPDAPMMHRDVPGKKVAGVCAALALQLGLDPVIVRVVFVALALATGGAVLWVYVLLWAATPSVAGGRSPLQRAVDWVGAPFGGQTPSEIPPQR